MKLHYPKRENKFQVLLAAMFHGDEDCLDVIMHCMTKQQDDVSFAFIPVVNVFGFKNRQRENEEGENINCSFNHPLCKPSSTTVQSRAIISNIDLIKRYSRDGYASLHVDENAVDPYSYLWSKEKPSDKVLGDLNVRDHNGCYNTLEDYLWHEGIPVTALLEFVGGDRVKFLNKFLSFMKGETI